MLISSINFATQMKLLGNSKKKQDDGSEMSFLDHLEQLRWHILRSLIAVIAVAIGVFLMGKEVFDRIIFAPIQKDFITYRLFCGISKATCIQPADLKLIRTQLGEEFFIHLKVAFFLGITLAMPYIIYQVWKFISPGLYDEERKYAKGFVFYSSFLFICGVLFGYFVITPFAVAFLSNYSVGSVVETTSSLTSYVNYMFMFTIPSGILFQLPIVVYFLSKIGVVTPMFLRKFRKHAYIVILILAAMITPPDVVSQILIGIPLYGLYEVSIIISKRIYKKQEAEFS